MNYSLTKSIQVLARTPLVMSTMLAGLDAEWIRASEGENTWTPYDVVGHLIHGEKTDWIPRMRIFLDDKADKRLQVFDRFAQFENSKGKALDELLSEFSDLRKMNVDILIHAHPFEKQLDKTAIHPEFGTVTLRQHLAAWVAHDLGHIAQICRVMAKQYKEEAGPWVKYLRILQS